MKKKILAISDIHGCLNEFQSLLKRVKYNPKDFQLILVGDYIDRGPKSRETIDFVRSLREEGAIVLRGNHDQMFIDFIRKLDTLILHNGGMMTLKSYHGELPLGQQDVINCYNVIKNEYIDHIEFLESLPFYHETEDHLFVHAGIDPYFGKDWKSQMLPEEMVWIRDEFIYNDIDIGKTVVFGHTPVINIHQKPDVWFGKNKIGIDGGCAFGYQLNALEIKNVDGKNIYKTYSHPDLNENKEEDQ